MVLFQILCRIVQSLSLETAMRFGRLLGAIAWMLDAVHRRRVIDNLHLAFGDDHRILPPEIHPAHVGRESFRRFGANAMAAIWMAERDDADLSSLIEVTGVEKHLLPAAARGKGVVHVMFHLGNWEALSRITSRIPQVKFSTVYQPLKNPGFDALIADWRRRGRVELINRHHGFTDAVKRLRAGEAVGMLVDQHAGDHGMWVPFFRRMASTTALPAILARRTGATIIPILCRNLRTSGKHGAQWRMEFAVPVPTEGRGDGEIMMEIHHRLEEAIRADPANWFWMHNRWKTPSPNFLFHGYRRGVHVPAEMKLKPFNVLVRGTNWLGDAVLTIPALRAIKAGRPDCHVTLLVPPKLAGLWRGQDFVDHVITDVEEAKGRKFDAAVLFPNSFRAAWEAWRLGIPRRQGYAGHGREWLLTAVCPESFRAGEREHDVKDFCGLAKWMGGTVESEIPRLAVTEVACGARSAEYFVVHTGAAFGSAKRWLPERFVELVKRFPNARWRLVGGPEETVRNAELAREMGSHVEDWTGKLDLPGLAAALAGARVVVCNDSGPMHVAAAAGARVVAIFGSTEPVHTGPLAEDPSRVRVLRRIVECSPCYLRECPVDLRCMKAMGVDEVEKAVRDLLEVRNGEQAGGSRNIGP